MEEQTVNTDELVFEASDVSEQAEEPTQEVPVEETNDEPAQEETTTSADTATPTDIDAEMVDYLSKKGISLDDPQALSKVAKMYREAEKGFNAKAQEKAQLERQLAQTQRPEMSNESAELVNARAENTLLKTEKWKAEKQLTPADEQKMVDYINQPILGNDGNPIIGNDGKPITKSYYVATGILSLDEVYQMTGCGQDRQGQIDELKAQLRSEVEKEFAVRASATRPKAQATDSTQFSKPEQDDPFLNSLLG